jgi:hypothetical protein
MPVALAVSRNLMSETQRHVARAEPAERPSGGNTFRRLYCDRFACAPEDFERAVLVRCLHRRAFPLALLCRRMAPNLFARDLETIRHVGDATTLREVMVELDGYTFTLRSQGKRFKRVLRLRISGGRLRSLAEFLGLR